MKSRPCLRKPEPSPRWTSPRIKGTGLSKGFAFVAMPTQADADKAISMFNDYALAENKLKVNMAKPRVERA